MYCRDVAHALLEKVDRYLWSPRPSALGPHIHTTLTLEKELSSAAPNTGPQPPLSLSPRLEDVGMHWGVKTYSGTCLLCRLPLTSHVSDRSPGVLTFLCGK